MAKKVEQEKLGSDWTTFGIAAGLASSVTRMGIDIFLSPSAHGQFSPDTNSAITLSIIMLTLAAAIKNWEINTYRVPTAVTGALFGFAIEAGLEGVPQVAIPLGIFSLGLYITVRRYYEPRNPQK